LLKLSNNLTALTTAISTIMSPMSLHGLEGLQQPWNDLELCKVSELPSTTSEDGDQITTTSTGIYLNPSVLSTLQTTILMPSNDQLYQPWRYVDYRNTRDLSGVTETWLETLEDNRDLSATSMGSCLQASITMNRVVLSSKAKDWGLKSKDSSIYRKSPTHKTERVSVAAKGKEGK